MQDLLLRGGRLQAVRRCGVLHIASTQVACRVSLLGEAALRGRWKHACCFYMVRGRSPVRPLRWLAVRGRANHVCRCASLAFGHGCLASMALGWGVSVRGTP